MVHSLITLFPPTATTFDTNGLGSLGEAISCIVTEERNGAFELEMVYPVTGKHYKDIENRSILYVKPNPVDPPQAFRIYSYTKPMDGQVTYQAEHISYDLSGYPVNPFTAYSCDQAMLALKSNSVISHPFNFRSDVPTEGTIRINTPTPIRSILGGSEDSLLEIFGGEYKFNNFNVELLNHRGMNRGVVIRYGKNLIDMKQQENMSEVYTDVLPYWYGEVDEIPTLVTLPEVTIATSTDYDFRRILPLDMSSSFQEKPFVVDLREAANEWIENNSPGVPLSTFEVSFAQLEQTKEYENLTLLERVELCDEVTVEYPEYRIAIIAKVTKTSYDVITQSYTSVTLGNATQTLSGTISGQEQNLKDAADLLKNDFQDGLNNTKDELNGNISDAKDEFNNNLNNTKDELNGNIDRTKKELNGNINKAKEDLEQQLKDTKTELEKATEAATDWITNGRGYMVAVKDEIGQWMELCSLDNPDLVKAINVWRWNNAGFGHSSHGYNGPYEVAITQDGKINAKFIVTGEMSANRIRGGILLLGGNGNGNGVINTKNSRNEDLCTIDSTGLNVYKGTITGTKIITVDPSKNYEQPTQIIINNSSMQFYEGLYTDTYVSDSYAGTIGPSPIWGCAYYYDGSDYVVGSETGYFPGMSIDVRYTAQLIVGGMALMDFDCNGPNFLTRVIFKDNIIGKSLEMETGSFSKSLTVQGLPVSGNIVVGSPGSPEEPSTVNVSDYSYSLLSPMKGDIGSGETDDNGLCYIYLDDYANSAMNMSITYYVFLQKEGPGDLWIKEKNEQYFIVEGTPNLKFSWELKGKQTGYEYERLEDATSMEMKSEDIEDEIINENLKYLYSVIASKEEAQLKEINQSIKDREEALV